MPEYIKVQKLKNYSLISLEKDNFFIFTYFTYIINKIEEYLGI